MSSSDDEESVPQFPKPPVKTNEIKTPTNVATNNKKINENKSNVKSVLGFEEAKSLVNWENRTLKVLRSNRIFGGKLKEEAVDDYVNNLDKYKLTEQHDPFSLYLLYLTK
jgi:hypothetical protein